MSKINKKSKQHHGWQNVFSKNKKYNIKIYEKNIGMLIRSNKLITKNNKNVKKAHLKYQGC